MKSLTTNSRTVAIAITAISSILIVACNDSSGNQAGSGGTGFPLTGSGGASGGGGSVAGQSGGGVVAGTGGTAGSGGFVPVTGGSGGFVPVTGGSGGSGGAAGVLDSGIGDAQAGTTADTGVLPPADTGVGDTAVGDTAVGDTAVGETGTGDTGTPPGNKLPTPSDYAAPGPFSDAIMESFVGPGNNYTMFRPGASLGKDGFKHPIVSWGNGITTTPGMYEQTLTLIATHGFVIIGTNDTTVEEPAVSAGLDWLAQQNDVPGDLQGKLDTSREATVGYSWGGGASIDAAYRPNVKCTVSIHGMPPRNGNAFTSMHAPLLLFTSTGDTFVSAAQFVTPNYEKSTVQTFYATLDMPVSHVWVIDLLGGMMEERAPTIAWLRMWLYQEEDPKKFFYGDDCLLCSSPWIYQRKNWP